MIKINDNEAYTDMPDTHRISRHGDGMYFTRTTLLAGETAEDFEEVPVDELPQDNEEE